MPDPVVGLVLAAGAGTRYGMPKAMVRDADGRPWLDHAASALVAGGCADVVVVLGALAEPAVHLVPPWADVVLARDWESGPGRSLAEGLQTCGDAAAAVVTLVDLPGLRPEAVRRVVGDDPAPSDLRRATYRGRPGHPVVLGRDHWAAAASDPAGAGGYLAAAGATLLDCTDLGGGDDVDVVERSA